ncbi:unnamed protein product [Pleuronectes platessa]|uniref:Uncharacterized protein n=1 Tax=Pleuronectes platessa TaxID=8262 RepID=A0A9N7ZAN4_PLEPL|nr:unnamed protein product [Pleuronectes platessa]
MHMTSGSGVKQAAVLAGRGSTRSLSNYCLSIIPSGRSLLYADKQPPQTAGEGPAAPTQTAATVLQGGVSWSDPVDETTTDKEVYSVKLDSMSWTREGFNSEERTTQSISHLL